MKALSNDLDRAFVACAPPDPMQLRFARTAALLSLSLLALAACREDEPEDASTANIVGGRLANEAPGVGYLLASRAPALPVGPFCGATLIASDIAVTAAHCVRDNDTFAVGFGQAGSSPPIRVKKAVTHPAYPGRGYRHDLAVLVLERPASVAPLPIAAPVVATSATTIGYGRVIEGPKDQQGGWTGERKRAELWIFGADGQNIWAQGREGALCYGDSGSALLTSTNPPNALGVLWGSPQEEDVLCKTGTTRIFTSLSDERAFIEQVIACKDTSETSACIDP
jgi:secreted trypsin-like serine protease